MEVGYNPCLTWAEYELVQAPANLNSLFSGIRPWGDFGMPLSKLTDAPSGNCIVVAGAY